jgi:hypothetical protein
LAVGETLDEFNDAAQKVGLLQEIASVSGGKYLSASEAKKLPEIVRERVMKMKREETVFEQRDIWDTPLWFGLVALCLSVEWLVRRRLKLI